MSTVAFGESTMCRIEVQLWYNRFKEGRKDINDEVHPGRPSTQTTDENIEVIKKMILDNCRITITEVADDVGIWFSSCQPFWIVSLFLTDKTVRHVLVCSSKKWMSSW